MTIKDISIDQTRVAQLHLEETFTISSVEVEPSIWFIKVIVSDRQI